MCYITTYPVYKPLNRRGGILASYKSTGYAIWRDNQNYTNFPHTPPPLGDGAKVVVSL